MGVAMKITRAITAGILGALVMTFIMWIAREVIGMQVNLEMMLGTMFGLEKSFATWLIGLTIHLMVGAMFGLIYAWCFENLIHKANWLYGIGIGAVHTVFSGVMLGAVPFMHPLIPEQMSAPGMFMANLGAIGIVAFTMLHVIFGGIVGGMYGATENEKTGRFAHHGKLQRT